MPHPAERVAGTQGRVWSGAGWGVVHGLRGGGVDFLRGQGAGATVWAVNAAMPMSGADRTYPTLSAAGFPGSGPGPIRLVF